MDGGCSGVRGRDGRGGAMDKTGLPEVFVLLEVGNHGSGEISTKLI